MLKAILLVSAALVLALAPAASLGGRPQENAPTSKSAGKINAEAAAKAKKIYAQDCALCHADNGNGQTDIGKSMNVMDWTKPEVLSGKSDEALIDIIRKGKGNMPPEGDGRADDATVKSILSYIRGFSKASAGAAAAAPAAQ